MILLDTNVLSALMRPDREAGVVAWLDRQRESDLHLTAITVIEARAGVVRLPDGARRRDLGARLAILFEELFRDRILPFDAAAATAAAELGERRRRAGRTVDVHDGFIAGIAISRGATIATRNLRHFADCEIPVIDPWAA